MNDLEAIARDLHLSPDSLKRPAELLKQGFDPSFLGTYRPDELGQMDTPLLARLKRGMASREQLGQYKQRLKAQAEAEAWWQDSLQPLVDEAQSIAEVDAITRNLRSRKSSRVLSQKDPRLSMLGQAILTMSGPAPTDLVAWVTQQAGVTTEQAGPLLQDTKQWLQVLLSEDAPLIHRISRQILQRGQLSVAMLAETVDSEPKPATTEEAESASAATEGQVATAQEGDPQASTAESSAEEASLDSSYGELPNVVGEVEEAATVASDLMASPTEGVSVELVPAAELAPAAEPEVSSAGEESSNVDPLLAAFPQKPNAKPTGDKSAPKKVTSVSLKQLSPRQRRRRWLRSILQRYARLKRPLRKLTHYQALMLGRGQRSQIISLKFDYDRQALLKMAREALCPGHHPMHGLLQEIADQSLTRLILPRLEQDVFAEIEEKAHRELTERAVRHFQEMLQQRPVRGHRILVIDAMGPKTAAVAIVDPQGKVDFTGDLSAVSSRPDVVAQNVVTLGQWIHQYKVSLVAISNGTSRRYLIHSVSELMKQSGDSGLRWTIVDRTGADAYCDTRQALRELPKIAKRHRAAVWLAWRLQDPLIELTKVDPARLRLGSYQRELPQETLEDALLGAVSASVASRGVDVWNSHAKALVCLPGVDKPLADAITEIRDSGQLSTREALLEGLRGKATEVQLRQAIGYLRVFASSQPLDGTMIHPDDYRLAERLVATGSLSMPMASPENWSRPVLATDGVVAELPAAATADGGGIPPEAGGEAPATTVVSEVETEASLAAAAPEVSEDQQMVVASTATTEASSGEGSSAEGIEFGPSQSAAPSDELIPAGPLAGFKPGTEVSLNKDTPPAVTPPQPENPTGPTPAPSLSIDVERLARSWQVGREKMRMVARCLQQPFADSRDTRIPIPLLSQVPTLESLQPGMTAWGIIIGVADFGAFVDLGPDCNGLIHVSRLSSEFVEDPHEVVQVGDLLQVWVVHVDIEKKRVALSALPPGVEQLRRASDDDREPGRTDRGFSPRGDGTASRPAFGRREQPQSRGTSGAGAPTAGRGSRSGAGRGRGDGGPGGSGPRPSSFQGRKGAPGRASFEKRGRDRETTEGDAAESTLPSKSKSKPAKPAPPITDAMQQGLEPMRSFSDLMQFFKAKVDEPSQTEPPLPTPPSPLTPAPQPEPAPPSSEPSEDYRPD
jgi:transcriptional accessory protein Tex/SPT6